MPRKPAATLYNDGNLITIPQAMRAAKFTELQIADNLERKAVKRLSEYMLYGIELTPADDDTNKENVPPAAVVPTSIAVRVMHVQTMSLKLLNTKHDSKKLQQWRRIRGLERTMKS